MIHREYNRDQNDFHTRFVGVVLMFIVSMSPLGCAQKTGGKRVVKPQLGFAGARYVGAFPVHGAIMWLDEHFKVTRMTLKSAQDSDTLVSIPGGDDVLVISKSHIGVLNGRSTKYSERARLPNELTEITPMGEMPHVRAASVTEDGRTLCLAYEVGHPFIPDQDGQVKYRQWVLGFDLKANVFVKQTCPKAEAKRAISIESMRLVQEQDRCGFLFEKEFYALPRTSQREGTECQVTIHRPLPSGRFVPVQARLGADDAMQLSYAVYIFDRKLKHFMSLRALLPDEMIDIEALGWEQTAHEKNAAFAAMVIEDLADRSRSYGHGVEQLAQRIDALVLGDKLLQLSGGTPKVLELPRGFIFLR